MEVSGFLDKIRETLIQTDDNVIKHNNDTHLFFRCQEVF